MSTYKLFNPDFQSLRETANHINTYLPSPKTLTVKFPDFSTATFLHPFDKDGIHSSTSQKYMPLSSGLGFTTVRINWLGKGWPNLS